MTAINDKKPRAKMMKKTTWEMKKTIQVKKPNTYEKEILKNTIPDALITTKKIKFSKKHQYKQWKSLVVDQKQNLLVPDHVDFAIN